MDNLLKAFSEAEKSGLVEVKNPEHIVFIPKSRSLILLPGDKTDQILE